jgi:D-arabinose 1-dehydrogenase-like Zn-dependent alcohol dehydrogenase
LTDAEAAALPLAGLTAWRAVFTKGQVREGQNVLITGIGKQSQKKTINEQKKMQAPAPVYNHERTVDAPRSSLELHGTS